MDLSDENDELGDLGNLQVRINAATDESLESTRRMLRTCEETTDLGAKTIQVLSEQAEQLDRVEEGLDRINQDMRDAEKNLEDMEKCCGLCILPWKKVKKFGRPEDQMWNENQGGTQLNQNGPRHVVGDHVGFSGGIITRVTNDAREDEMEENLGQVSTMVSNLRNMAVDMGNELETQNQQLDRIYRKADANDTRIQSANQRAAQMLKK